MTDVLALDLARTTGWARGMVGGDPTCGSVLLASAGASHGALCHGLIEWLGKKVLGTPPLPDVIVFEAPLPVFAKRGKRNANADRILSGLCFATEGIAHCRGIYDVREASSAAVRHHFIGGNFKREQAKTYVIRKCKSLGWLEASDDDAADALATWSYMCSLIDPMEGLRTTELFNRKLRDADGGQLHGE